MRVTHALPRPAPPRSQVIGFPLELLGVMSAGALALRYLKEGVDPAEDAKTILGTLTNTLPGFKQ